MATFISKGFLNPPSGVEDGLSQGTLNRAVENSASLTFYLEADDVGGALPYYMKHATARNLVIRIVAVGAHTNVSCAFTFDSASVVGTNYGARDNGFGGFYWYDGSQTNTEAGIESELGAGGGLSGAGYNMAWTCAITGGEAATWTATFTRANLAAGTHYIYLAFPRFLPA